MKCRRALRFTLHPVQRRFLGLALLVVMLVSAFTTGVEGVSARSRGAEDASGRVVVEHRFGAVHYWLVKSWADQTIECELFLEGDTRPGEEEIRQGCGELVVEKWASTPACKDSQSEQKSASCEGLYLVYLGDRERRYEYVTQLPEAEAHFQLDNCPNGAWCGQRPGLFFYGVEPLADEQITAIHVRVGTKEVSCLSAIGCQVLLPTTTERGTWLEYWVESSYGDESDHQKLFVRNVFRSSTASYYLELLSAGLTGDAAQLQWTAFPSLDHPNAALYSSTNLDDSLFTDNHLYYLSGRLITAGEVDASDCGSAVLLDNGNADTCGEAVAYEAVVEWQNQFDHQILTAGRNYGLPAKILKGIVAQESQFWSDLRIPYEYGFGSLTENGVDSLLTTDSASFLAVCVPYLSEEECASGYAALTSKQQAKLRGLVLRAVGTESEIDLIARVLLAQVVQVGQVTRDVTQDIPGQAASYEDLWDLTIASYHSGVGCINSGLKLLRDTQQEITFEAYCRVAPLGCQSGCTFTRRVKDYAGASATSGGDPQN